MPVPVQPPNDPGQGIVNLTFDVGHDTNEEHDLDMEVNPPDPISSEREVNLIYDTSIAQPEVSSPQSENRKPGLRNSNRGQQFSLTENVTPEGQTKVEIPGILSSEKIQDENSFGRRLGNLLVEFRANLYTAAVKQKRKLKLFLLALICILFNAHLVLAINYTVTQDLDLDWCNGLGFLIILTLIVYWSLFYYWILKRIFGRRIQTVILKPIATFFRKTFQNRKHFIWVLRLVVVAGVTAFLVFDTWDQPRRLVSAFGVVVLLAIGFLLSKFPTEVNWGQVTWSIGLQFSLGLAVLRWEVGRNVLNCLSSKVTTFLNFATAGSDFVYGYLSSGKPNDDLSFSPIFAFKPLSVMFFFGFCISLLYHFGYMQWIILKLGWVLQSTIGTTAVESMNASANIFLGMLEAPLLIKPFLGRMTNSEIHTIMSSGFATVAGSAFAAYITFGISASYVISATVMAAFCSLGYSKLIYPETEASQTTLDNVFEIETRAEGTAIDAAAQGAMQGVTLVGCVIANIVAFVAFVAFLNSLIGWFGSLIGLEAFSFEFLLGKIFVPVAWVMGIDPEECETVAVLLGLKTVANEFIAYQRLVKTTLSPRSRAIASFALCSFANVGSVGISLGGLTALVPERRIDFGQIVGRAFLSGTIVGFLNGCVAGILINEPGYAEWAGSLTALNSSSPATI